MKLQLIVGCFLFCFLLPFVSNSQPKGVSISKKSGWVEIIDYDAQAKPDDRQASSYYYLLTDEQENTSTQEIFEHYVYKILTSEGIQEMSDLSFEFEPSYQQLILHEIKIIRDGATINHLTKDIQVIQREQSLESNLYDGTKTAIVNLKDVRVGDIVEYSFTRKGYNPVHKGHISRTYYTDSYETLDKSFRRITLPVSHKVTVKSLGEDVQQPVIKRGTAMVDYSWTKSKAIAKEYEYGTPAGITTDNIVMISDFSSWREVGEWAKELFVLSAAERDKVKKEIAPKFVANSDEDYILKVIRFVQDEVRYLGIETGINTHKPYPPSQIYEQRFGDCKDKSLLLVTLLQSRDIEAYPMLINTSMKQSIDKRLPAGNIFDHCVVQIVSDGKTINIDPTMSNQGGDLDNYYFPDYRRGLVIDDDVNLKELPEPEAATTSEIHTIDALTIGGEAMLTIRTTYTGSDADYQRSSFAQTPLETMQKNFKDYYANLYPDLVVWDELKFYDDRTGNKFTVEEKYKIPTFWKPIPNTENQIFATIQPMSFGTYFDVPKNIQQRTQPYYLSYPVDIHHTIHVNLPEEFPVPPVDRVIENDLYQYEYLVKRQGREITKMTHYKTKKDNIPVDQIQQYVSDHSKMYSDLVLEFTYDLGVVEASKNVFPGVITSIVALTFGVFLCFYLYQNYDPEPARYMVRGLPIGSWLFLLAIGLVFGPVRLLYEFVTTPELITGVGWLSHFAAKNYGIFLFFFIEHIYNVLKVVFTVLLMVLFFQRRSSFPRLMTINLAVQLVIIAMDTFANRAIVEDASSISMRGLFQVMFAAAIWIPYLNISQRVKDTFVIRGPNHNDNDSDEIVQPAEVFAGEQGVR
jgi:transglutaminase-like putative cysteine protease